MRHDHPVEWVWFAMTLVDAWISASSWVAAHGDWRRAQRERAVLVSKSLPVRVSSNAVTYAIEVSASMNTMMAAMLLTAAVASLFLAPPPPTYKEVPQTLFLLSVLIGVSALNALIAFYGRLVRYRLSTGYYERSEARKDFGKPAGQGIADSYKPEKPS